MKIQISPEILRDFPGFTLGLVVVHTTTNTQKNPAIGELIKNAENELTQAFKDRLLAEHPHIACWRDAYRKFGARPNEYQSSVESLAQRARGKKYTSINPLVDIYNYISLTYLLPLGGQDLDHIEGDIVLTYAGPEEEAIKVIGKDRAEAPSQGEVIYKDQRSTLCRRWNWKEAERVKITPATTHALFLLEALPPVTVQVLQAATYHLAELIDHYCGGSVTVTFLDEKHPEATLKESNQYVPLNPPQKRSPLPSLYGLTATTNTISDEHHIRVQKVEKLRQLGIEPWPPVKTVTATCQKVIEDFEATNTSKAYTVSGRVMSIRLHGKAAFAHIQDRSGKLQVYIKQDRVGDAAFAFFKEFIDIGDILWCSGSSFRTKTGEVTLEVEQSELLAKSLYPLPEKFHGLTDIETKYRQRYLDLIISPETKERFTKRSLIIKELRRFLDAHDFIEVETPMLHPIAGGAAARPFITRHNALDSNFYLRIAPELYLKRLVIGGIERVYEINRNFRNEGISTRHNPEFTMLEFYMAYQDYHFIMSFVEDLLRMLARQTCHALQIPFDRHILDFEQPFQRISMSQSLVVYGGLTEEDITPQAIDKTLQKHQLSVPAAALQGEKIAALFGELAEHKLIQPTFITDFPVEISPLAKRDPQHPNIAARFELFIAGMEISNGFNELNDPYDQAERFKQQEASSAHGNEEAHQFDSDYVHALEYALPPSVGVGIGIDRLTMLLTNTPSIKEVILFPTLKHKHVV